MIVNGDFTGTLNISETKDDIHGYYRPLIESDMWSIELRHQWHRTIFKILFENKCSLLSGLWQKIQAMY